MSKSYTRKIAVVGMTAAAYVAITLAIAPLSYGLVQFRISELLNLLVFLNPIFAPGVVLGCFIANMFSPYALFDMIFGTLGTLASVLLILLVKKMFQSRQTLGLLTASFMPVVGNFIIGAALGVLTWYDGDGVGLSLFNNILIWIGAVSVGQIGVCVVVGFPLFLILMRNKWFVRLTETIVN
jgi:uncharacterized membrane protein